FKGYYLLIYNKQTKHYETYIVNKTSITKYKNYTVLTRYSVYVRAATIKFKV
ncbi:uncharacterized protein K441DRAFT_545363, partial [Cenococcum geophilum 1.58]|uniref:uncharacterized protein n=1 Tax=Cenococcum geophilum 1.58 TaxID=794803 RepID=UPI00358E9616